MNISLRGLPSRCLMLASPNCGRYGLVERLKIYRSTSDDMKWPNTLTVVRHAESAYNVLKAQKEQSAEYGEFRRAYERRETEPGHARELALQLIADGGFALEVGDHDTGLTPAGERQALHTGARLSELIPLPDVVLLSPYLRAHRTLHQMTVGWPPLADVRTVEEERLREQEFGLALLYNDWRVFQILHPEQEALRRIQGPYWYRHPQGENVPDVRERIRSVLGTITRDYHDLHVLVITHHLAIIALRANLERLNAEQFDELDHRQKPRNCGVTIYRGHPELGRDGRLILDVYNAELLSEDGVAAG